MVCRWMSERMGGWVSKWRDGGCIGWVDGMGGCVSGGWLGE